MIAGLRVFASAGPKSNPPKKRTTMRGPVVPYTSLRCNASKIAARVFAVAHNRGIAGGGHLPAHDLHAAIARREEGMRGGCSAGLGAAVLAEEIVLIGRRERGVRVGRTDHTELERIDTEILLQLEAELEPGTSVLVLQHL